MAAVEILLPIIAAVVGMAAFAIVRDIVVSILAPAPALAPVATVSLSVWRGHQCYRIELPPH